MVRIFLVQAVFLVSILSAHAADQPFPAGKRQTYLCQLDKKYDSPTATKYRITVDMPSTEDADDVTRATAQVESGTLGVGGFRPRPELAHRGCVVEEGIPSERGAIVCPRDKNGVQPIFFLAKDGNLFSVGIDGGCQCGEKPVTPTVRVHGGTKCSLVKEEPFDHARRIPELGRKFSKASSKESATAAPGKTMSGN